MNQHLAKNQSLSPIVLHKICWHVSKDENIDIWNDPWIPTIHLYKPQFGPKPQHCNIYTVADLIDADSRTWKVDTLNTIFPQWVVKEILLIHLSRNPREDYIRWMGEKNRIFSVKSAYNFLQEEAEAKKKRQRSEVKWPWKLIWKAKVAERAKLNLWKALKDGLPTKGSLAKRGVPTDTNCIRCQREEETVTHALFSCPLLKDTWMHSNMQINTSDWKPGELFPNCLNPFPLLVEKMLNQTQGKEDKLQKLAYIAALTYAIWMDRNNLKHTNKKPWEPHTLLEAGKLLIKEDNALSKPTLTDWPQIPQNHTYLTTDASWVSAHTHASIGFALWNHSGCCLCAGFTTARAADAQEAEARGVVRGVELAKELGVQDLMILSDCQTLVTFLQDGTTALSWGATSVAQDILHLSSSFDSSSFAFISREFNHVADVLAKAGKKLGPYVCFDPAQIVFSQGIEKKRDPHSLPLLLIPPSRTKVEALLEDNDDYDEFDTESYDSYHDEEDEEEEESENMEAWSAKNTDNHQLRSLYSLSTKQILDIKVRMPCKKHCRGSCFGWLVTMEATDAAKYSVQLFNPFLRDGGIINLPPLDNIADLDDGKQIVDRWATIYLRKTLLSANRTHANSNYIVVAIVSAFSILACLMPGSKDWIPIEWDKRKILQQFCDIIYFNMTQQFYAVKETGEVYAIDLEGPIPKLTHFANPAEILRTTTYLVESWLGDLLLIAKKSTGFEVFKLDPNTRGWIQIYNLCDNAIFIGDNANIYVSASKCFGCKPNCIYHTKKGYYDDMPLRYRAIDNGIFNLKEKTIESHFPLEIFWQVLSAPIWIEPPPELL